jgi:hypothetical protein
MKIKAKPNLIIFESVGDWAYVREKIKQDYGQTIFAISWRLKRELGFTVRYHKELKQYHNSDICHYQTQVHLDFFNEANQSWFILKYVNIED